MKEAEARGIGADMGKDIYWVLSLGGQTVPKFLHIEHTVAHSKGDQQPEMHGRDP